MTPCVQALAAPAAAAFLPGACNGSFRDVEDIAVLAQDALLSEVHTWPKPGLVSHIDAGSHDDMDCSTFEASAESLLPYFRDIAAAGAAGMAMHGLRALGIQAEHAMMAATGGVNTHRGAIFGVGLLCAAAGYRERMGVSDTLGDIVAWRWGASILGGPRPADSNGISVLRRYGAGGARAEAAAGFPSLYRIALPALRQARLLRPRDSEAQRVQALFALVAEVEDTNLLHRGGPLGGSWARAAARSFLVRGGIARPDWRESAAAIHREFVARRLSPGGCADLLAMALFVDSVGD